MKFLKILKEYNQAIIKENQKLKSIYETLLKESEGDEDLDTECDVSETDDTAEDTGLDDAADDAEEKTNEADEMMTAVEFFKEAEGEEACADEAKEDVENVAFRSLLTGDKFLKALRRRILEERAEDLPELIPDGE